MQIKPPLPILTKAFWLVFFIKSRARNKYLNKSNNVQSKFRTSYVALKKGHRVRKARGKTRGNSIPPYYYIAILDKHCSNLAPPFCGRSMFFCDFFNHFLGRFTGR